MDNNLTHHFIKIHPHEVTADKNNLKIAGLETLNEFISSLRLHTRTLKNLDEGKFEEIEPLTPYCNELEGLRDEEYPSQQENDFLDTASLISRNLSWIPRLKVLPSETLVYAGAAHYVGFHGIIHLLAQEEFTWFQLTVQDDTSILKTPLTQEQYVHPDERGFSDSSSYQPH